MALWFDERFWSDFEKQMKMFRKQTELLLQSFERIPKLYELASGITEEENKIVIRLDIPGNKKEDLQLLATEHSIEVKAQRREEKIERGKQFYRHERAHRAYYRILPMPAAIKPNTVSAEYKDGVLKITAEKKEAAKEEKKVKIKVK